MVYSTMGWVRRDRRAGLRRRVSRRVSTSIQTSYRVFRPATGFNRMKTASHWASVAEFSDDKMSLSGDVISIQWDAALPGYRVRADIDSDVSFDFEFTFVGKGVTTKTYYNESEDTGYSALSDYQASSESNDPGSFTVYHKLIPRANVTGKITVEGEELNAAGTGFLVNAVQLNPQNVKRWVHLPPFLRKSKPTS